jgi:hypothetical protein
VSFLLICQFSFAQSDSIIDYGQRLILQNKKAEAITHFNKYLKKPENTVQQIHLLFGLAEIYKLNLLSY